MKKILYLHGFASSGASGTVELLRREFWERRRADKAAVLAPDLPVDPAVALPMLKDLSARERPDLVIGTSMGAMYAQQLRGFPRVCVNPAFRMSSLYSVLSVGRHKWLNRRRDGAVDFQITKEIVGHFREMEEHQFDGLTDEDRPLCHGLFGDADETLDGSGRAMFERLYPGQAHVYPGGHRMNADVVNGTLIPFIICRRLL
ncbi:MAG: hypothetical protein J6T01_01795 [Kiritimatiellae bacterium]|nr:hypothetical protein [Kiritimatiellia bacterium]